MKRGLGDWPLSFRVACALGAYVVYGIADTMVVPTLFDLAQSNHFTSVPVYMLHDEEASGFMGVLPDPAQTRFEVGCDYALFVAFYGPIFYLTTAPWWIFALLFVLNEPLLFLGGF